MDNMMYSCPAFCIAHQDSASLSISIIFLKCAIAGKMYLSLDVTGRAEWNGGNVSIAIDRQTIKLSLHGVDI